MNVFLDLSRIIGVPPFDFTLYQDGGGNEWQAWLRSFEWFVLASKIEDDEEKFVKLMHLAGQKVQELYTTLPVPESVHNVARGPLRKSMTPHLSKYEMAVAKLNDHFLPKKNATYERHELRQLKQEDGEKIALFAMRLRKQADRCGFEEKCEEHVKDQLIEKCTSAALRRKLLALGDANLETVLREAKAFEAVQEHSKALDDEKVEQPKEIDVNKIDFRQKPYTNTNNKQVECHRCGYTGHRQFEDKCPARGKTCNKCLGKDHFARKCRSRKRPRNVIEKAPWNESKSDSQLEPSIKAEEASSVQKRSKSDEFVKFVHASNEKEYLFHIDNLNTGRKNEIKCKIGGVQMTSIIDSGSKYNIVDQNAWEYLKANKVQVTNQRKSTNISFEAYGEHPLSLAGIFEAEIEVFNRKLNVDFYVFKDCGKVLIGYDTATMLGILKIGENINHVDIDEKLPKVKGIKVNIPIDTSIKPIAQPFRRIPVALEETVNQKIEELLRLDVIEKVNGPSKWISPLVVVPKGDDVRVCVDMRCANQAVKRENHPLPTFEDFLPHLGKGKVFAKLDIKNAFHQVKI